MTKTARAVQLAGALALLFAAYRVGYNDAVSDVIGALAGPQPWYAAMLADWKLLAALAIGVALLVYGRWGRFSAAALILPLLVLGCAHGQQASREEIRKAREMWRAGEAWRRTQPDFPPMSRQDRIDLARLYFPSPQPGYESDYARGLALLERYRLTGSEWVYWEAVGWMTTMNESAAKSPLTAVETPAQLYQFRELLRHDGGPAHREYRVAGRSDIVVQTVPHPRLSRTRIVRVVYPDGHSVDGSYITPSMEFEAVMNRSWIYVRSW